MASTQPPSSYLKDKDQTLQKTAITSSEKEHATNDEPHETNVESTDGAPSVPDNIFQLTVKLPRTSEDVQLTVSTQEQVQDVRQSIIEFPHTFQYSCFHLEHKGKRINDFIELSEVEGLVEEPTLTLVEDPYTDAQARMHVVRVRELIGASGNRIDLVAGIDAGISICDGIELAPTEEKDESGGTPVSTYDFSGPAILSTMLAKPRASAPKTIKNIALSVWNPPPHHLRLRGHLMYLQVTTNEGDQFSITSHFTGFYVNKSTNNKFDPSPRTTPKSFAAHSLISLLGQISPSFDASFRQLQEYNGERELFAAYQLSNTVPAAPWLVSQASLTNHQADLARTQESFLLSGVDNAETLRDWNEEFQSTKELPKESVQDRVFRERLTSKLFAEYNEAAVRGAVLVARGEVQPLNPTEARDAQIFVHNNVFYSFGADGVGTFASDGGDEAARVATGKDVMGVRSVNQLDINGLFTPGTVVVDYLGKRIVGQSIVPGIFKQREPGEHQIDYGGVEGKDVIATHPSFVEPFSELSKATRVKAHAVWDKDNGRHELEASVETKGLLGTDGRKYILDLYRLTPLDIAWLEEHRGTNQTDESRYPHRMTVLRPELIATYRITKLREYIAEELERKRAGREKTESATTTESDGVADKQVNGASKPPQEPVDISGFTFSLNPDVFCGQQPQTDEDKAEWAQDEADVRAVGTYLIKDVLPSMIRDMQEGDVGFPMDGQSLVREMHKRGINVRYLGKLASLCDGKEDRRLQALSQLFHQEMVSRAFKHICNEQLRSLPPCATASCVSHLLNCLLGADFNAEPSAEVDQEIRLMYPEVDSAFAKITAESLRSAIVEQISLRYRYELSDAQIPTGKHLQYLREVSYKLGLQLEAKDYTFSGQRPLPNGLQVKGSSESLNASTTNGTKSSGENGKKKKKKTNDQVLKTTATSMPSQTFHPENILNIVPIIKEASPRSVLAEEALEAGRVSLQQDQKELGQELLMESLSLHEQIYGIVHPEVARMYYAMSTLYYGLDEKAIAAELARKAVIISERTLGVDSAETLLAYLNLSLFEHATGNTRNALTYIRHALELWKIVYGVRHPDSITTINNAAVMLQTLKEFHESRLWFENSLDVCEEVSGRHSINTATLLFQLAQALALDQDTKAGVARMRESYAIFKAELGPENQNTKEAESWLETLTHSAVNQAKQANFIANRRLLLRNGRAPRVAVGGTPQPLTDQTPSVSAVAQQIERPSSIDQRSVEELMKYINGEPSKQSKSKKKTTNPKRRQQTAA